MIIEATGNIRLCHVDLLAGSFADKQSTAFFKWDLFSLFDCCLKCVSVKACDIERNIYILNKGGLLNSNN